MFSKTTTTKISVLTLAALLAVTGCAKKTPGLNDSPSAAPSESAVTQAPEVTLDFGTPLDLGNGIKVTLSQPVSFVPGVYASNFVKGEVANRFEVSIENGGTSDLDVTQFIITSSSNGEPCVDVLDGDSGINGAPTDPLAAGASVKFNYAIACHAKIGAQYKISVTAGASLVGLTGTLK